METLSFKQLHVDYQAHVKNKAIGSGTPAATYNQCIDYFREILKLFGIKPELFKEGRVKNQTFQFAEEDKTLVFDMLDRFTDKEFVSIRQGEFHDVAPETMEFYINGFRTMLSHLEIPAEEINEQIKIMKESVFYHYFLSLSNVKRTLESMNNDIKNKYFTDDWLSQEDKIVFLKFMAAEMKNLQDMFRHVYMQMDSNKMSSGLRQEINLYKLLSAEDKTGFGNDLKNNLRVHEDLSHNTRFVELREAENKILSEKSMLKHKAKDLSQMREEMADIIRRTEIKLFGSVLPEPKKYFDESQLKFLKSEALLVDAIDFYANLLPERCACEPGNPLIADEIVKNKFED